MRSSALSLGAALLALACGGCDHSRAPANGSAAAASPAPAAATAVRAQPPAGAASTESAPAPVATTSSAEVAKPAPATAPAAPVSAPVPGDPSGVRRITVAETNALREQGRAVIVDVRDKSSYDSGHVAGAVHIPLDSVAARLGELPRDKPIVTYCA